MDYTKQINLTAFGDANLDYTMHGEVTYKGNTLILKSPDNKISTFKVDQEIHNGGKYTATHSIDNELRDLPSTVECGGGGFRMAIAAAKIPGTTVSYHDMGEHHPDYNRTLAASNINSVFYGHTSQRKNAVFGTGTDRIIIRNPIESYDVLSSLHINFITESVAKADGIVFNSLKSKSALEVILNTANRYQKPTFGVLTKSTGGRTPEESFEYAKKFLPFTSIVVGYDELPELLGEKVAEADYEKFAYEFLKMCDKDFQAKELVVTLGSRGSATKIGNGIHRVFLDENQQPYIGEVLSQTKGARKLGIGDEYAGEFTAGRAAHVDIIASMIIASVGAAHHLGAKDINPSHFRTEYIH